MKQFIVKDTIINLETKEVLYYFNGKDGYTHDFPQFADGWKLSIYAQKYIEKSMDAHYIEKLSCNVCIESKKWLHVYEIIERD